MNLYRKNNENLNESWNHFEEDLKYKHVNNSTQKLENWRYSHPLLPNQEEINMSQVRLRNSFFNLSFSTLNIDRRVQNNW